MNTQTIRIADRHIHVQDASESKRVRYASDKAVKKAHKRAVHKFANMFRKLAE